MNSSHVIAFLIGAITEALFMIGFMARQTKRERAEFARHEEADSVFEQDK